MSHEFVISAIALTACLTAELLLLYSRRMPAAPMKVNAPAPLFRPASASARHAAAVLYATATLPRVFSYATATKKMALSKN
jgi:hypothetical protein